MNIQLTRQVISFIKCVVVVVSLLQISACGSSEPQQSEGEAESLVNSTQSAQRSVTTIQESTADNLNMLNEENNVMTLTGEIRYQNFEGGFYGFIAQNGDKYMPSGLKSEHRKTGLIVEIKAQAITDRATTVQFGTLIKILDIKVLDASKVEKANDTW